ncbi:conserved hypothetical protein [Geotrichum candidum]|uniref:Uncharacterized protein n=1 Tax=Geotrichum candidum TaxID=1173061 RepID=A0A0J9X6L4_GEOCN|nr:conserved hypothetical protein [Geotrichum candidum]
MADPRTIAENLRTFSYAHETNIDFYGSIFGISSIQLKVTGTPISGTGSISGNLTGLYKGTLSYNDIEDLTNKKYQLILQRENGNLRIDFIVPPEQQARFIFYAPLEGNKLECTGIFQFN